MSFPAKKQAKAASRAAAGQALSDGELQVREAVVLWLRWNDAYERITERLYGQRCEPEQAEALLDQLDGLRQEAIRLSHDVLD